MRRWAPLALIALLPPLADAAAPNDAQVVDEEGDCAVPYGNAYLDVTRAWIENEKEATFDVVLEIASFDAALGEGAGYTVQFTHQGKRWGVVAWYSQAAAQGGPVWNFLTGQATADSIDQDGLAPASGEFVQGAPASMHVAFAKSLFPHVDADDHELRDFWAASVDLRPAMPFIVVGADPSGRWILCDEAQGRASYFFARGHHSAEDAAPQEAHAAEGAASPAAESAAAPTAEPEPGAPTTTREVASAGAPLILGAVGAALVLARRAKT